MVASTNHVMAAYLASRLPDHGIGFIGVGSSGRSYELVSAIPIAAAYLAVDRGVDFRMQIGPLLDIDLGRLPAKWSDNDIYGWPAGALTTSDANMDAFARGTVTVGFVSGAQIDRWGNINVTQINLPDGIRRLGGALAVSEHLAFAVQPVILADLSSRVFVERVDYVSGFGHRYDFRHRTDFELPGPGPVLVVTDRAAFDFGDEGMRLIALFGKNTLESVLEVMSFTPDISDDLEVFSGPDARSLSLLEHYPLAGIGSVHETGAQKKKEEE